MPVLSGTQQVDQSALSDVKQIVQFVQGGADGKKSTSQLMTLIRAEMPDT